MSAQEQPLGAAPSPTFVKQESFQQQQPPLHYPSVLDPNSSPHGQSSSSSSAPALVAMQHSPYAQAQGPYSAAAVYQAPPQPWSTSGTREHPLVPKRRRRTTPEQLTILEAAFVENPLPSQAQRAQLAARVDMTGRALQVWFQNRR